MPCPLYQIISIVRQLLICKGSGTAAGKNDFIRLIVPALRKYGEYVIFLIYSGHGFIAFDLYMKFLKPPKERSQDRLRCLRVRINPTAFVGRIDTHSSKFRDGILRCKQSQDMPGKFTVCSVVAVRGIPCVCNITSAVPGLKDLSPGLLFFLENDNLRAMFGGRDCREESGGTAADYENSVLFRHFRVTPS